MIGSLLGKVEKSGVYGSMHTTALDIEMATGDLLVAHDGEVTAPKSRTRIDLAERRLRVYRAW